MKFVIGRFCFVTKIMHLLHVNNIHETKVYKRIFKQKKTETKKQTKKANKQATTRKKP